MEGIVIREARSEDLQQAVGLIVRMKRLNEEFDPLFKGLHDVEKRGLKFLTDSINSKDTVLLVATRGKQIFGILRAEMEERVFYEPAKNGKITDFYILPEGRRKTLGNDMLDQAIRKLRQMGAGIITAEFPAQNEMAVRFYQRRGFRHLITILAKE